MNPVVWSYSENEGIANEVATAAAQVAEQISARSVVLELGEPRSGVLAPGGKLLVKGPSGTNLTAEVAAEAIFRAARNLEPTAILLGATRDGRETASRVAAKLKVGCLSEAFRLAAEPEGIVGERNAFAGKVIAKVRVAFPAVITVKAGAYARSSSAGKEVEEFDVGEVEGHINVVSRTEKEGGTVDLKKAKIIVSAGRGIKRREDLPLVEALAKEMGGALGCSRPLSSDLGWLPEEHHIGLTGVTVKPDLYLAVGISGQLQHIAGMKDSKVVVAVNTDKDAPIFQSSDYGIVGDLYQVVPAIQRALKNRS